MENLLTRSQIIHAVHMWACGCDTLTIANYFEISEATVHNDLPGFRKRYPKIRELAAA